MLAIQVSLESVFLGVLYYFALLIRNSLHVLTIITLLLEDIINLTVSVGWLAYFLDQCQCAINVAEVSKSMLFVFTSYLSV